MKWTANRLCLFVAIWIVATANLSFWQLLFRLQPMTGRGWLFTLSLGLAMTGLVLFIARVLSPGRTLRVMLTVLLVFTAAAAWFMDTYGVAIDSEMLRNVLQTNPAEARDFVGWPLLWRILWQAGIPAAVVWTARLPLDTWPRAVRDYVLGAVGGVVLLFGAGLPLYSSYASYFRNHDQARYLINPANYLNGSITLARKALRARQPYVKVGEDARRDDSQHTRPLLVVVVVGETARAANFSLGGYARDTNPLLAERAVHYFSQVRSCGTATALSVPCMFSDLPRDEFELAAAAHRDSVLDILQRAGVAVNWVDNQSGCKQVCARVPSEMARQYQPEACQDGECLDSALLAALESRLPRTSRDAVLVLHAMGSHGPTYHRRVPPEYQRFKPICATERIETCSDEQIVNSYDNSIAYTDFVLAGVIDRLAAQQARMDSVLLYVSDHGESLGEAGLYLHGQPYLIAPEVQKHVPMLMWFSPGSAARLQLDERCLRAHLRDRFSHDNLSHTLLGLHDVHTSAYRPVLDVLRPCRGLRTSQP